jgi:hypothetical protein
MRYGLQKLVKPCRECDWSSRRRLLRSNSFVGGIYLDDQRFCSVECLESHLLKQIQRMDVFEHDPAPSPRIPLGLLLLERGLIDHAQLRQALEQQGEQNRRIGSILQEIAGLPEEEIALAVARQWSVPFVEVLESTRNLAAWELLPRFLSKQHGALMVHSNGSTKLAYLAFTDRIKHSVVHAAEQITGYRVEPCIGRETQIESALERYVSTRTLGNEIVLIQPLSTREAAGTVASYAANAEASFIRMARCVDHLWVRFEGKQALHVVLKLAGTGPKAVPLNCRN